MQIYNKVLQISPIALESCIDAVINHPSVRNAVHRLNDSYKKLEAENVELGNGMMVQSLQSCLKDFTKCFRPHLIKFQRPQ